MDAPILQATGLVKSYGGERVVDGLSFVCHPGAVLRMLGPNFTVAQNLRVYAGYFRPRVAKGAR